MRALVIPLGLVLILGGFAIANADEGAAAGSQDPGCLGPHATGGSLPTSPPTAECGSAGHEPAWDEADRLEQSRRNAELAEELSSSTGPGELSAASAAWQSATLGLEIDASRPQPEGRAPSTVVERLATRAGGDVPEAELARLDEQPEPRRTTLAGLLAAYDAYREVARLATGEDPTAEAVAGLLEARTEFVRRVQAFSDVWEETTGPPVIVEAPPAIRLDLTTSCEGGTYTADYLLQVDTCGDDTYLNNAGGSGVDLPEPPGSPASLDPCLPGIRVPEIGAQDWIGYGAGAASIDLAGDDTYASGRSCGINGGGYFGSGFLLDARGDDTYRGWNHGINGGARQGFGFLLDGGGNDTYESGASGVNGGGFVSGYGKLIDLGGEDRYEATREHLIYGYGANGAGGGYDAVGFLYDAEGHDVYSGGQEGVNGGGYGAAVGFLFDRAGDDVYRATYLGVNGEGQVGVGTLYDASGHDWYETTGAYSDRNGWDVTIVPKNEHLGNSPVPTSFGAQYDAGD